MLLLLLFRLLLFRLFVSVTYNVDDDANLDRRVVRWTVSTTKLEDDDDTDDSNRLFRGRSRRPRRRYGGCVYQTVNTGVSDLYSIHHYHHDRLTWTPFSWSILVVT